MNKNDNKGEFLDFYEFILYMISKIFHENSHYWYGRFQKIAEIIYRVDLLKLKNSL